MEMHTDAPFFAAGLALPAAHRLEEVRGYLPRVRGGRSSAGATRQRRLREHEDHQQVHLPLPHSLSSTPSLPFTPSLPLVGSGY